jgi:Zn-dependent oligopeptidase
MGHHTSVQICEKFETVFQSYYSYLWMDIILTGLYVVIQERVEKETGKNFI